MADLKELLGDAYKEEFEGKLIINDGTYVPKANAEGELNRVKGELAAAKKKQKELEEAQLSEEQKAQRKIDEALRVAGETEATYKKELAKMKVQSKLQGFDLDDETLALIAGSDPDAAEKAASGLFATLTAAKAAGEAAANAAHLKNNQAPTGQSGKALTQEEFNKLPYTEHERIAREQPELYRQYAGG